MGSFQMSVTVTVFLKLFSCFKVSLKDETARRKLVFMPSLGVDMYCCLLAQLAGWLIKPFGWRLQAAELTYSCA